MVWEIPEDIGDFNSKYSGTVGKVTYKSTLTSKEHIELPMCIDCLGASDEGSLSVMGSIFYKGTWRPKNLRVEIIEDLRFFFPYMGYVRHPLLGPVYISRNPIKQYSRGWNRNTLLIVVNPVFSLIARVLSKKYLITDFAAFNKITGHAQRLYMDDSIINWVFNNNICFNSIDIPPADDPFVIFSPELAGINSPDGWKLFYKTYAVGTCFPFTLFPEIDFLEDVIRNEVLTK